MIAFIIIIAIIGVPVTFYIALRKDRKMYAEFHQHMYHLLGGAVFYDIVIHRLDNWYAGDTDSWEREEAKFNLDIKEARDTFFKVAYYHYKLLRPDFSEEDIYQQIETTIYPNFLEMLTERGEVGQVGIMVMPLLYLTWLEKIVNFGVDFFDVNRISSHPNEREKGMRFLLKNLSRPHVNEMEKLQDRIDLESINALRYLDYWARFGYPSHNDRKNNPDTSN